MRVLLDTHVLLWWRLDPARVTQAVQDLFTRPGTDLLWSAASTWEMAIKSGRGRLRLPEPVFVYVQRVIREERLTPLPVEHSHAATVETMPLHHMDPFDRLLIAQAQVEGVPLVTADPLLRSYGVPLIW